MTFPKTLVFVKLTITFCVILITIYAYCYLQERGKFTKEVRHVSDYILSGKVINTSESDRALLFHNCREELFKNGYSDTAIHTRFGDNTTTFSPRVISYVIKSLRTLSVQPIELIKNDSIYILTVEVKAKPDFTLTLSFVEKDNLMALTEIVGLPHLIEKIECTQKSSDDASS